MIAACDPGLVRFTWLSARDGQPPQPTAGSEPFQTSALPVRARRDSAVAQIEFSLRACAHIVRCRHAFDVLYLPMAYFPAPLLVVLGRLLRRPVVVRIARGEASRTRKPLAVLRQRMLRRKRFQHVHIG